MTWNYQNSHDRVSAHLRDMGEIEVEPLVREMDFDNLTETRCRQIFGAHVYAEAKSLPEGVTSDSPKDEQREIVQMIHIWQREVARIADAVGAVRIHFQGGRVHLVVYRPIRDEAAIATKAIALQLILDRAALVFNDLFPAMPDLDLRSGSDIGEATGTRNGSNGARELLFLGRPANHAAKLLWAGSHRRLTKDVFFAASVDALAFIEEEPDESIGEYRLVRPSVERLQVFLDSLDIAWSPDDCRTRVEADQVSFPAASAGVHSTTEKVVFDDLSYSNSKIVDGATLYGDVSGFTAYIDGATTDEERKKALRAFHAIRREMAAVVKQDFNGVRVQYQGDRVQGLFHLPADDPAGISNEAVRAAVGLQSSFEHVLKDLLPEIAGLGIAVGVSRGTTIAAKLGQRGHRDRICLGSEVLRAERNEERVGKKQIGISQNVKDNLDADLAEHFTWDTAAGCHVATGLDYQTLDLAASAKAYAAGRAASILTTTTGPIISTVPNVGRAVKPSTSWGG
jgi:hypothetical protein